jgi:hypothetical protein
MKKQLLEIKVIENEHYLKFKHGTSKVTYLNYAYKYAISNKCEVVSVSNRLYHSWNDNDNNIKIVLIDIYE